jgi:hypothetical protein
MHRKPSWEALQECLRGGEAAGKTTLIQFDNAEEVHCSVAVAQVCPWIPIVIKMDHSCLDKSR